jgi:hypothetical protein
VNYCTNILAWFNIICNRLLLCTGRTGCNKVAHHKRIMHSPAMSIFVHYTVWFAWLPQQPYNTAASQPQNSGYFNRNSTSKPK